MVCRAETRATVAVGGQAPEGVTLLGTTSSIAEKLMSSQVFLE
jgi:hypothetical protein